MGTESFAGGKAVGGRR